MSETQILGSDVYATTLFFGTRLLGNRDLGVFADHFQLTNSGACHSIGYLNDKCDNFDKKFQVVTNALDQDLQKAKKQKIKIIFLILTWATAKNHQKIVSLTENLRKKGVIVCPIIWDEPFTKNRPNYFDKMGLSYLYFDRDAQTAGARKLNEFIQRILGYDLPGKLFPNYSQNTIIKIAEHINHENFNGWPKKTNYLPKYIIKN